MNPDLRKKTLVYLIVRIAIINFVSGFLFFMSSTPNLSKSFFLGTLIAVNFLFLLSLILLQRMERIKAFLYAHFIFDVFLITVLSFFDGGVVDSDLPLLFYLIILAAGVFFYDRGSVLVATIVSISYISSFVLLLTEQIPAHDVTGTLINPAQTQEMAFLTLFINLVLFYIASYVISNLGMAYLKKGEEFEVQRILLDDIFENVTFSLFVFDHQGLLSRWNSLGEAFAGKKLRLGLPYSQVLPDEIAIAMKKVYQHHVENYGDDFKRGQQYFNIQISAIRKNDNDIGYMVLVHDITAKKALEEKLLEMDKLAYLGTLGAGMAHELRNPLASLYGSIQLLDERPFNEKDRHLYGLILREAERLNKIVSDFLDFVKGEHVEKKAVPIKELIREVILMLSVLTEKEIRLNGEDLSVVGDRNLLIQTFNNLIWNAVEASDKEEEPVMVDIREEGGECLVEVRDTGIGIDPEELNHIFTPFYSKKKKGAGLGLAIVKKNIMNMDGRIEVESRRNKGTAMRIFLPRARADIQ